MKSVVKKPQPSALDQAFILASQASDEAALVAAEYRAAFTNYSQAQAKLDQALTKLNNALNELSRLKRKSRTRNKPTNVAREGS